MTNNTIFWKQIPQFWKSTLCQRRSHFWDTVYISQKTFLTNFSACDLQLYKISKIAKVGIFWDTVQITVVWKSLALTNRNGPHNVRPYNHSRLIKLPMTAWRPTRNHYNHNHSPLTETTYNRDKNTVQHHYNAPHYSADSATMRVTLGSLIFKYWPSYILHEDINVSVVKYSRV